MTFARRLPDFLIVGATKCGTTSIHRWLSRHPQVWMPEKELRFFTIEHHWSRGVDWYAAQFADAPAACVLGEASNSYTRDPVYAGVPERIAGLTPDVRIIYLVREPFRRLESHYRHRLVTGIEWRDPDTAIRSDPCYLAASCYGRQLERYRSVFPGSQILMLRSEELFAAPKPMLARLAAFLDIDPALGPAFQPENVTSERLIAPWPLRRVAGIRALKGLAKRVAAQVARSPLRRFLKTADMPAFTLGADLRSEIEVLFREDQALLARLAGETFLPKAAREHVAELNA